MNTQNQLDEVRAIAQDMQTVTAESDEWVGSVVVLAKLIEDLAGAMEDLMNADSKEGCCC